MAAVWRVLLLLWVCIWLPAQARNAVEISRTEDWTQSFYTEVGKTGDGQHTRSMQKRSTKSADVEVYSVKLGCIVTSRFAHTIMTSKARNKANSSQEVFFEMDLPKTAFITNFTMEIDGRSYVGEVKEKEKAKKQYDKAVSSGQTAGLVKASGRKMEKFSVSINIAAQSSVTFILIYEELLQRKLGKYEILSRLKSEQPVEEFQIQADIYEPQGISFVEATATFLTNDLLPLVQKTVTDTTARIYFSPTAEQQKCLGCEGSVINGDFIITYDVKRDKRLGEIQAVNGYFVHFFYPPDLPRVPKNVVFVIDVSGSMGGTKIKQTREAMIAILNDLHEEDHFAIILFDDKITTWKKFLTKAKKKNVNEAIGYVKKIREDGATNINAAVLSAVKMLQTERKGEKVPERSADMIILLTDGMPNSGVSSPTKIQENVRSAIGGNMSLFSLGFGNNVAYSFLDVMSRQNKGLARRIFEASDAVLQLQGFYEEVSSPLLLEVDLRYSDNKVGNLTKNHHSQLFNGSEIVVAGQLNSNDMDNFLVEVFAQGPQEDFVVQGEASVPDWPTMYPHLEYVFGDFTERLWAYLTIQQLLENSDFSSQQEKDTATAKALNMSLQYGFVTPLTSMIVTKPETEDGGSSLIADKLTEDQRQKAERQQGHVRTSQRVPSLQSNPIGSSGTQASRRRSSSGSRSDVDGDPHFLIELPDRDDALCFNINDEPGTVFNLVRDPESGFLVNGQIIGKKKVVPGGNVNTYFGRFVIVHQKLGVRLEASTRHISVSHGGQQIELLWSDTGHFKKPNMDLRLTNNCSLTVTLKHSVRFMVIKHTKVWKKRHDQQDYLGFYTLDSHHLSAAVHGLLGQFYHGVEFEVERRENLDAIMYVKGQTLNVTRHWQKDFSRDVKNGESTPCWFVSNDGAGLIDGTASDYIVSDINKAE
ncbi:inter-alpha-trypsin inhibitor heavy chain H3-like [Salarias fasciatus]|nr:inter-alpha-trypsin inhibitor heavy chain H3-like [Salarias fasciatus]